MSQPNHSGAWREAGKFGNWRGRATDEQGAAISQIIYTDRGLQILIILRYFPDPTDVASDRGKKSYRTKTVMIHSASKGEPNTNGYAPLAATSAAVADPNDVEIEQPQVR